MAVCYFDGWHIQDKNKAKVKQPKYAVPLAVGIGREDGSETSIFHLEEFIYDLRDRFEIGCFSADQFASRQLLQDLNRDKIPAKYISVDRTDEAYIYLKTMTNAGLIKYANNGLLKTELSDLRHIGNKCDHTSLGSKDVADAVCGAIFSCYQDLEHASQLSNMYKAEAYTKAIQERSASPQDTFVERIQSLY